MTLWDFKQRVLRLIEEIDVDKKELTDDPDISNKFNTVTNQLMFELFRYKGIIVKDTVIDIEWGVFGFLSIKDNKRCWI